MWYATPHGSDRRDPARVDSDRMRGVVVVASRMGDGGSPDRAAREQQDAGDPGCELRAGARAGNDLQCPLADPDLRGRKVRLSHNQTHSVLSNQTCVTTIQIHSI